MATRAELEQKSWYRFCKVIFGAALVFSLIVVIIYAWDSAPKTIVNTDFSFDCLNENGAPEHFFGGQRYTLSDTLYYPTANRETEAPAIDKAIRNYCQNKSSNPKYWFSYPNTVVGSSDDPSFNLKYALRNNTSGSWSEVMSKILVGGFGVILVFGIIVWIFNYIVFGEKPQK